MSLINFMTQVVMAIICVYECVIGGSGGENGGLVPLTLYQPCVFKMSIPTKDLDESQSSCVYRNFQESSNFIYVNLRGCQILKSQSTSLPGRSKNLTSSSLTGESIKRTTSTMTCLQCFSSIVYIFDVLQSLLNYALLIFIGVHIYRFKSRLRRTINEVVEGHHSDDHDRHEGRSNNQLQDLVHRSSPSLLSTSSSPRSYSNFESSYTTTTILLGPDDGQISSKYVIPQRRRTWHVPRDCDTEQNWRSGSSSSLSSSPHNKVQSWRVQQQQQLEGSVSGSSSSLSWREEDPHDQLHQMLVLQKFRNNFGNIINDVDSSTSFNSSIFSSEEEDNSNNNIEKNDSENDTNNNNDADVDDDDEDADVGFELVTRKKKKIDHRKVKNNNNNNHRSESAVKKKIFISTLRTNPHFLQGEGKNLRRLKDIKDHVKFWKMKEGAEWNQPKNCAKTIFPHEMRKRLEAKVKDLMRHGEKLQELPQSEGKGDCFTYLALLDESGEARRQIIDLGHSEAVQLTRRVDGGLINAAFVPSTPVQFIPFLGRSRPASYPNDNMEEVVFFLHFNTEFIAHLPLAAYPETSFSEPESMPDISSGDDDDNWSDHDDGLDGGFWSVNNNKNKKEPTEGSTRLIKRSRPYLLEEYMPLLTDGSSSSSRREMKK